MRIVSIALVALLFTFVACAKKEEGKLSLRKPQWADGEVTNYDLSVAGESVGSLIYTIRETETNGEKSYEVDILTTMEGTTDHSVVTIRRDGLKPLREARTLETQGGKYIIFANYTHDKVSIEANTPQGKKSTDLPIPENAFDNEVITLVLRTIPFKEGFKASLTSVAPISAVTVPIDVEVLGSEKITVSAGDFDCQKVKMKLAGRGIFIWYERNVPQRMIKYEDAQTGVTMSLTAGE